MPATTKSIAKSANNAIISTPVGQRAHKRWYPPLPSGTHQAIQNANRFTWDALYQLREQVTRMTSSLSAVLGSASTGTNSAPAGKASGVASSSGVSSSGSTGSSTGPSNSQILGLNVKAVVPANSQSLVYNSTTGQFEPTNTIMWTTVLPAHHNSLGIQGTIAFDPTGSDTHLYLCVNTNLWGRVSLDETF